MILFKVFVFVGFLSVLKAQTKFMPNLPMGAYRLIFSAIYQCDKTKDLPIKMNVYLSKKTFNSTEMKGNFTLDIPFEDSYILDANFASWSLTGGWKPNSLVYVTDNACTKLKIILGNAWFSILKAFNFSTTNCPLSVGIFKSTGFDTILYNDNNFPKVYFYGKYKFTGKLKDKKNKQLACIVAELNVMRPWESLID
ncbi:uncharacterized protein LOC132949197 [Metopolophium dirhodum]|uniref:uncharacterized protein LOC132949197 n=1 Tax=Metopolophium dirhodum TaxID=44670 RepID=UPI00298FF984|nr:uncharacterized protein LOC132949197 [Metopolophium dirhodum]